MRCRNDWRRFGRQNQSGWHGLHCDPAAAETLGLDPGLDRQADHEVTADQQAAPARLRRGRFFICIQTPVADAKGATKKSYIDAKLLFTFLAMAEYSGNQKGGNENKWPKKKT